VARVPGALLNVLATRPLQSSCEMVTFLLDLGKFCELHLNGVLGSSAYSTPKRLVHLG
jgi:hypothetical protein